MSNRCRQEKPEAGKAPRTLGSVWWQLGLSPTKVESAMGSGRHTSKNRKSSTQIYCLLP